MRDDPEPEPGDMTPLLERYEGPLLQFAGRILNDHDRARDVVQETFIQWERNGAKQHVAAPAKWLFTVCRNRALDVCRKENRMTYLDDEFFATRSSEEPSPSKQLEEAEAKGFLLKIVATLPPRQQEVLQLKFQNDLSYEEISEITNLSISNVGVLLHTALKTLRQRYAQSSKDFLPFVRTAS